jgi:hypothetical protein
MSQADPAGQYLVARRGLREIPGPHFCDINAVDRTGGSIRKDVINVIESAVVASEVGDGFDAEYWSVVTPATPFQPPIKTQWCGIYAVWVWTRAGIAVKWKDGVGPTLQGSTHRMKVSTDLKYLAPGDIIVKRFNEQKKDVEHHMIVINTTLEDAPKGLRVLQGNSAGSTPATSKVTKADVRLGSNEYYFYSLDSVTDPGKAYSAW